MADLIDAVEAEFVTDYAILFAGQDQLVETGGHFASSSPGCIACSPGTKSAHGRIRAERWDGRPPYQVGWEDMDELPFQEDPDEGPLILSGFDATDAALDISGLGRARAVVFARGRHGSGYGDVRSLVPEEWLIQLFPDPQGQDAMAGDPRRLAGAGRGSVAARSGFSAAARAWRQTGWYDYLQAVPGFNGVGIALGVVDAPITRAELAERASRFLNTESNTLLSPLKRLLQPPVAQHPHPSIRSVQEAGEEAAAARRERMARWAGLPELVTMADLLQALVNLGLLVSMSRGGREVVVPNACPDLVWEAVDIAEPDRDGLRRKMAESAFGMTADEVGYVWSWAPEGRLVTTARRLAVRLALDVEDVLGAVDLVVLRGGLTKVAAPRDAFPVPIDRWTGEPFELGPADTPFVLESARRLNG